MSVADQMISERGIDDVSMREIVQESGQKNASVIAYHFGGRDGLLLAVFRNRLAELQQVRLAALAELDAAGQGDDIRALVEVSVRPIANQLRDESNSHYVRFAARMTPRVDFANGDGHEMPKASEDLVGRLRRAIQKNLPEDVAAVRVSLAMNMMVGALAAYEQRQDEGLPTDPLEETVSELIDMIVGALTAPHAPPG